MNDECMFLPPLKPCPFCGGEAELVTMKRSTIWKKKPNAFYIRCCVCLATSRADFAERDVIRAWNRRGGESNEV